jgi:hypothetical protein
MTVVVDLAPFWHPTVSISFERRSSIFGGVLICLWRLYILSATTLWLAFPPGTKTATIHGVRCPAKYEECRRCKNKGTEQNLTQKSAQPIPPESIAYQKRPLPWQRSAQGLVQ